jgi:hypothetical protein
MIKCAARKIVVWDNTKTYNDVCREIASSIDGWYLDSSGNSVVMNDETGQLTMLDTVGMEFLASEQVYLIDKRGEAAKHPLPRDPIPRNMLSAAAKWVDHPRIWNVLNYPFFDTSFTLSQYGYDKTSGYFCSYKGKPIADMSLDEANQILNDLTVDMLFSTGDGQTSRATNFANYIGYLLTPLILPALPNRKTPMFVF